MIKLICDVCKKEFLTWKCRTTRKHKLYCSKECSYIGRGKQTTKKCPTCGKMFTNQTCRNSKYCSIKCYRIGNRAENNYNWGGNKTSYRTKHKFIVSILGKADHCEHCGLKEIPKGKKRYFQWANISGKHIRNASDYISLCVKCHKHFDGYGN